jgi:hypothetical protein
VAAAAEAAGSHGYTRALLPAAAGEDALRTSARALVVAVHGPGTMAQYGSVAGYCCKHSAVPLVLLPEQVCGPSS